MKNGKSKKNSSVPSSVDKEKTAPPPKGKLAVKASAAKQPSNSKAPIVSAERAPKRAEKKQDRPTKRAADASSIETKTSVPPKGTKKKVAAPPMPAAIVRSAMKRATATPGISPAVTPVDPKPTKPSSGVKAAGKLLKSSPPPIDKSKAVERRPAPNAGANVETATPKETRLIEPQAVVAPAVRPTVGSPPPAPKQRFVRFPAQWDPKLGIHVT